MPPSVPTDPSPLTQPSPPQANQNHSWMIISVLVVLVAAAVIGFFVYRQHQTPAYQTNYFSKVRPVSTHLAATAGFSDWNWYPLGTHFNPTSDYYIVYHDVSGTVQYVTGDGVHAAPLPSAATSTFQFAFSKSGGVSLPYGKNSTYV